MRQSIIRQVAWRFLVYIIVMDENNELIIDRLCQVGFDKDHAGAIVKRYNDRADIKALLDYIETKESINRGLSNVPILWSRRLHHAAISQ